MTPDLRKKCLQIIMARNRAGLITPEQMDTNLDMLVAAIGNRLDAQFEVLRQQRVAELGDAKDAPQAQISDIDNEIADLSLS